MGGVFGSVTYSDRTGYTTMGTSVFDAAANALEWVELHRRDFGTARRFRDDEILRVGVGMVPDRYYRVRIGKVREWQARQVLKEALAAGRAGTRRHASAASFSRPGVRNRA